MSKHMTIINLANTITKVRKWGEGWKHSAESAHAEFAELHRKHKEAERIIETLRANLTQTEAESRVESLRLKAELAVVKDERDQLRAKLEASEAESRGYYEELRRPARNQAAGHAVPCEPRAQNPRYHPVKVGEYLRRLTGFNTTPAGEIAQVIRVHVNADAESVYDVLRPNGEAGTWIAKNCTPCDPPEATHITLDCRPQ